MNRTLIVFLVGLLALGGCRKRANSTSSEQSSGASTADSSGQSGEQTYRAPPPVPVNAPPPPNEVARFNPPEPMNMYSPAMPGDYQSQLDTYNRVLRRWLSDSSNAPRNLQEIMGTFNSPKPPQPPAGRRLVYDPKSRTVSLL
jgi:hypothetical protein